LLGLPRLLQLLLTPWAHAAGEPIAAAIVVANMTINVIFHPTDAFDSVAGQAFFEFREPFDHLRAAVAAATSLLILFEDHLPCWAGDLGQAYLTYIEAILELVRIIIYAIIFPHYVPGPDPPTDCVLNPTACQYPVLDDWTIFNIFPPYYDWEDNALRRTLRLLQDDADCMALTLGCDNVTLPDDNCTDLPFQCALRTSYLMTIEAVNQTLNFIFYLPDLVRFDKMDGFRDFSDLSSKAFFDYANDFVECLVTWYVFLFFWPHTYTHLHTCLPRYGLLRVFSPAMQFILLLFHSVGGGWVFFSCPTGGARVATSKSLAARTSAASVARRVRAACRRHASLATGSVLAARSTISPRVPRVSSASVPRPAFPWRRPAAATW
jgi:hypothetical protein